MKEAAVNENPVASVMMPEPQPVTEITEEKKLNPLLLIGGLAALGIVGFLLIRRMKK